MYNQNVTEAICVDSSGIQYMIHVVYNCQPLTLLFSLLLKVTNQRREDISRCLFHPRLKLTGEHMLSSCERVLNSCKRVRTVELALITALCQRDPVCVRGAGISPHENAFPFVDNVLCPCIMFTCPVFMHTSFETIKRHTT